MATAPRRETLIALRARRTAHRVASALHLHQHSRQLLQKCPNCGREFLPQRSTQTWCGSCWDESYPPLNATDEEPPAHSRNPLNWRALGEGTVRVLAFLAILILFAVLIYCGMKLDLARVFGL